MKKAATYVLVFIAFFLSLSERVNAIAYTLSVTGNWNVATNWTPNGIPGVADDVTVPAALTVTVSANADINNITLQGAAGTRLIVNTGQYLQVWGTMNGPSNSFSNALITTNGTGKVAFRGNSRALFGANWAASPHQWTVEINLSSAGQIGTSSTNVKFGTLTVTQGVLQVGTAGAYKELRLTMNAAATTGGNMTIGPAGKVITGICGRQSAAGTNYCTSITVNGTLEVHGDTLSGSTITINNGGILSIRKFIAGQLKSYGATLTNFVYNTGSTLEFYDDPSYTGRHDIGAEITQATGSNIYNVIADHTTGIRLNQNFNLLGTFTLKKGNVIAAAAQAITYGPTSTLKYNGIAVQNAANTGGGEIEFPVINGPRNLTIDNSTAAIIAVTLFNPRTINGVLDLTNGRLQTTSVNLLTLGATASAINASNVSFVSGPLKKIGNSAFTYPIGKNTDMQTCAIGINGTAGSTAFWSENFTTGAGWNLASVQGPEGSDPNPFIIGAYEGGGIPPGGCGVANNGNNTMHVGSVFNPTGGAAYDAGGLCGILFCPQTNRRAESPTINCTGYTGITLSFNYIEFGSGTADNMTLWYFDGTTWSQLSDPAKTPCCGGACNGFRQGMWTAYSIALPSSANNNPNIKIGYKWENNDDGVGTDPSFAVDDISLSVSTADEYTAEYYKNNPQIVYNNSVNAPLNHISQCEYWTIVRNIGTINRTVTLSWDMNSCGVTLLSDLRIAYFNGTSWDDKGNGGTTGTVAAGTIVSGSALNTFGPFTLASVSTQNPLPVQLISFTGVKNKTSVDLKWTTASELNSDYFMLEKSSDKKRFEMLAKIPGAGTSNFVHNYIYLDKNPFEGLNYYRLFQTDFNGNSSDCGTVALRFIKGNDIVLSVNYQFNEIIIGFNSPFSGTLSIHDVSGRQIFSDAINNSLVFHLNMAGISSGIYLLRINDGSQILFKRFYY